MSVYALNPDLFVIQEEADRRFRRVLSFIAVPALIAALSIPFLKLAGQLKGGGEPLPTRYAQLLQQPPAAPIAEKTEEPKPVEEKEEVKPKPKAEQKTRPEPTQEQKVAQARKKAASKMKWTQALAALSDAPTPSSTATPLSSSVLTSPTGTRSTAIARAATETSGGIGEVAPVERTQSGTGIGTRRTTTVEAPKGIGTDRAREGQAGDKLIPGRTLEEIQLVFDRNKGAFYSLYNRALRQNPNLRGKVVIALTIAPDGSVTSCKVVASELHDPDLEDKIAKRVLLLNFGAKDVPPFTYPNYPLVFLPI